MREGVWTSALQRGLIGGLSSSWTGSGTGGVASGCVVCSNGKFRVEGVPGAAVCLLLSIGILISTQRYRMKE